MHLTFRSSNEEDALKRASVVSEERRPEIEVESRRKSIVSSDSVSIQVEDEEASQDTPYVQAVIETPVKEMEDTKSITTISKRLLRA